MLEDGGVLVADDEGMEELVGAAGRELLALLLLLLLAKRSPVLDDDAWVADEDGDEDELAVVEADVTVGRRMRSDGVHKCDAERRIVSSRQTRPGSRQPAGKRCHPRRKTRRGISHS